jgi:AraC-like DNA-binding protein
MERHLILKTTEFLSGELPVAVHRRDPQPDYPLHSHEFSELVIVYGGSGEHFTEDSKGRVSTGDVFLIPGGMSHGYRLLADLKLVNIVFDLKNLDSPLSGLPVFPSFHILLSMIPDFKSGRTTEFQLSPEQLETIMSIVFQLELETFGNQQGGKLMAAALFMQLSAQLIRFCEQRHDSSRSGSLRLGKVISYINHNYQSRITVPELARLAGMSESTLSRAFKKTYGCPPLVYCVRLRLHKAGMLLKNSELSISEIASAVGFPDSNYFSRAFRENTGISPRDYRNTEK